MSEPNRPEPSGFFDMLFGLLREAFADIRHKVVEEGWFGRQVTDDTPSAIDWLAKHYPNDPEIWVLDEPSQVAPFEVAQKSFDKLWAPADRDADEHQAPAERDGVDL